MKNQKDITYANVGGVDGELRKKSKRALSLLKSTYNLSRRGNVVMLPYGKALTIGAGQVMILEIEGVGTKVLFSQLAAKMPLAALVGDCTTIGIDGAAMVVNDYLRAAGVGPDAIADNVHAMQSDPIFVEQIMEGIVAGAFKSQCPVIGGEIGDVADIIKGIGVGMPFDLVCAASGVVHEEMLIHGDSIQPGDVVVGLRSSGLHSNGYSLVRKIVFKQWGGKYEPYDIPEGFDREIIYEALTPTEIYVEAVERIADGCCIKGLNHITGSGYLKFGNLMQTSPGIGFDFGNFSPQPIFEFVRKTARETRGNITDEEMFRTFNMGRGMGVVIDRRDSDTAIDMAEKTGMEAEVIGNVTDTGKIFITYQGRKFELKEE